MQMYSVKSCCLSVVVEDRQFSIELEEKVPMKPTFSTVIKDVEVVEGSAARFDCKIEGNFTISVL